MRPLALALLCLLPLGCDKPASTPPESGAPVTDFHVSIYNACNADAVVEVGAEPGQGGRKVLLFKQARETIQGGSERLFLLGKDGEVLATYQPVQGDQKVQVTSDCTALEKAE